jgi:[FeFe] hydrogenase H-cluster maturation GTPase HydF
LTNDQVVRPYIAVLGRRNVGKSLLVNSLVGQNITNVSDIAGTTKDSLKKSFELIPYGPVVIFDTAGIDDEGELGKQKISETIKLLSSSDFVIVVVDARMSLQNKELELLAYLDRLQINYIIVVNKIEFGVNPNLLDELKELRITHFEVSCKEKAGIEDLKRKIIRQLPGENQLKTLHEIISPGDVIVLVLPSDIDSSRIKLIDSQITMIRKSLDEKVKVIVSDEKSMKSTLDNLKSQPDLVIIDSNSFFDMVDLITEKAKITTYSILMTYLNGDLQTYVKGIQRIKELNNGDRVLIAEGCSQHEKDGEVSSPKIAKWLNDNIKKKLRIDISQHPEFPDNLLDYRLIIHCNGSKLTRKAVLTKINEAKFMDVPIINYGVFSAFIQGAIPRALVPFEQAYLVWKKLNMN